MSHADQYHEIRAKIATEGAKALLIISGGGIVALLGFLSTIWDKKEVVVILAVLEGIWLLAVALMSTAANFFFRYWASVAYQSQWPIRHQIFWSLEWASIIASFTLFLLALYTIVSGAAAVIKPLA